MNNKSKGQQTGRMTGKKYDTVDKKQINLWLEPSLIDSVDQISDENEVSRAMVVRTMLRKGVNGYKAGSFKL